MVVAAQFCVQTIDELAHALAALLAAHRLQGALMVGHSYGTFAVSRLRQLYPEVRFDALFCEVI